FVSSQNARRQEQCETSATSAIAARAASSMSPSCEFTFSLRAHAAGILPRTHHLELCNAAQNEAIGNGCSEVLSGNEQDADGAVIGVYAALHFLVRLISCCDAAQVTEAVIAEQF
ncbi:hypothetical protein, partial [Yoonia sediminilitoris]|uniref:hypothetical protein n=1 Tax=Yoonia sediminilitoris TaxID=1286148 RepID=UPI001455BF67